MNIGLLFAEGIINKQDTSMEAGRLDFNPHKTFQGIALKDLVKGADTGGAVSCHLVKVDPHCCLEAHVHPEQVEIHKVIQGSGSFHLGDRQGAYEVGTLGVIPAGVSHRVQAGPDGLYILATFSPALL